MAVNKIDLTERAFTPEAIDEFCKEKGIDYVETSALSGYQVQELFDHVCDNCMKAGL